MFALIAAGLWPVVGGGCACARVWMRECVDAGLDVDVSLKMGLDMVPLAHKACAKDERGGEGIF
jgi:hypothetical protein